MCQCNGTVTWLTHVSAWLSDESARARDRVSDCRHVWTFTLATRATTTTATATCDDQQSNERTHTYSKLLSCGKTEKSKQCALT